RTQAAPLETIGLFGFAWTSLGPPHVHWIAPMIFSTCIAIANVSGNLINCFFINVVIVCHLHGDNRLHDRQLRTILCVSDRRKRTSSRPPRRDRSHVFYAE
ncbi:hypothetical protein T310_9124, partial [Rasamsonia emersonii CBS 393.64]